MRLPRHAQSADIGSNRMINGKCKLMTSSLGKSVIANRCLVPGETVLKIYGNCVSQRTIYTVQIDKDLHLDPAGALWGFVNHSCRPNATIDPQRGQLIALDVIKEGEEIFWNYLLTEEELSHPFECTCKHANCVGVVKGYRFLNSEQSKLVESQRQPSH